MRISFLYPFVLWLLLLVPLAAGLALLGQRRPTPTRFWAGLALRACLITLIVLALAGIQLRLPADSLTAVFLLDVSDSIPASEQAHGETIIRQAIESMPGGDKAAIVLFGQDALVERIASEERLLPDMTSVPITSRTDIAGALQLGLALFPDEGAKRLVLLSDGRENLGQALAQAELAAAHGIELTFLPLSSPQGEVEVLLQALDAPANVRQGQGFDLTAEVHSTAPLGATLRVFGDGKLIHSQPVRLQTGSNRFLIPVEATETGFRRFHAQVVPDADTRLQNNEASAFTVVHGPPHLLVVEGQPGEADNLSQALRAAEMEVNQITPADLPTTLPELATFDSVVLVDVPATALPSGTMETLQVYVRDLGKGLLMIGGENAFGAGGYLRTPLEETLPVDMDIRSKEQSPNLALALAVDKSGSMGRCHCDDPNALPGQYTRVESGQPKVDIAKEAVMRAASALGQQDYIGVVAFDDSARWAVEMHPLSDYVTLEGAIGGIQAVGQTNLRAGVEAAYAALQDTDARRKHLILMTDGWVNQGDLTALARDMQDQGITLSIVAAGGGAAEYLAQLAESGGGRFYPAVDILRVPDLFLKETIKAVGRYIIEEPLYPLPSAPSPVLRGLDPAALPMLLGYNGTTPKSTAFVILSSPRGDPLLATWSYGLGRSAVWTSDLKGQWASDWVVWDGFARFATQLVGWTLPAPQVEGLMAEALVENDQAVIRVEATDQAGQPRNFLDIGATLIGPDLESIQVPLEQVGAGRYQAMVETAQPGTYLVRLGVSEAGEAVGQQTLGLVIPYSPEYRSSGTDHYLLSALAHTTGGDQLAEPAAAFLHNLPAADRAREIWTFLLLVVALLFPLDVALRRVILGPKDVRKATAWVRERLPARPERMVVTRERTLGRLFGARDRIRERQTRGETTPPPAKTSPQAKPAPPPAPPPPADSGDTLERLREAKKRARRDG